MTLFVERPLPRVTDTGRYNAGVLRLRTWPLLLLGFGALMLLIGGAAAAFYGSLDNVYGEVATLQGRLRHERSLIDQIRSDLFLTAILVRDYLLESSSKSALEDRASLEALRSSVGGNIAALEKMGSQTQRDQIAELRDAIDAYWRSLDPVLTWTPEEKTARGRSYLRRSVLPHRKAVLEAIGRLGELNARRGLNREREVLQTEQELKSDILRIAALALILGSIVAVASILRTSSLESAVAADLLQIENSANELRRLSHKLSGAQEDERRTISRELHDQVGQMLTALRLELGNIEEFHGTPKFDFSEHMGQAKKLTEETLRAVRNMSAGLRPSVLDQLGLGPALQWQAREFTKRSGVPVDLHLKGDVEDLPDGHRTCIYRIVQEGLTNCARHSQAKSIRVALEGSGDTLSLTIADDGVGFNVGSVRGLGSGLLGIEERVRELWGKVSLQSAPGKGTTLRCDIPKANPNEN